MKQGGPNSPASAYVPLDILRQRYTKQQLEEANVEEISFHKLMQMSVLSAEEVSRFRDTGYLVVKQILTESQCRLIARRVVEVRGLLARAPSGLPFFIIFFFFFFR